MDNQTHWISELEKAKAWLEEQRLNWENLAAERDRWIQELQKGNAWLEQQRDNWERIARNEEMAVQSQAAEIQTLKAELQALYQDRASIRAELDEILRRPWLPPGFPKPPSNVIAMSVLPLCPSVPGRGPRLKGMNVMHQDLRDEFLSRVVAGKTFADVGGLWGTVNEKVSVAHDLGAREVSMLDITPEGAELWTFFHDRMKSLGIGRYGAISSDVCRAPDVRFQVVHCSGVLYHHPSPMILLESLRRIAQEHLVLTSAITQTIIENRHGTYCIPPSGVLFVPALSEGEREILAEYWRAVGAEVHGITVKVKHSIDDFGPWWWLPTAEAMVAMAESCGFEVLDRGHIWNRNAYTLLLKVR